MNKKEFLKILLLSLIGIAIYLSPLKNYPALVLVGIGALAIYVTILSLVQSRKNSANNKITALPLIYNGLFFIPLIFVEYIFLKSKGMVFSTFGQPIDLYQSDRFFLLFGVMVTIAFGIGGAAWNRFSPIEAEKPKGQQSS